MSTRSCEEICITSKWENLLSKHAWQLYAGQSQDVRRVNRLHLENWVSDADRSHRSRVSGRDKQMLVGSDEANNGSSRVREVGTFSHRHEEAAAEFLFELVGHRAWLMTDHRFFIDLSCAEHRRMIRAFAE